MIARHSAVYTNSEISGYVLRICDTLFYINTNGIFTGLSAIGSFT